ncbi:hypothetical protein V2J09_011873 [Rumex salicifolius]
MPRRRTERKSVGGYYCKIRKRGSSSSASSSATSSSSFVVKNYRLKRAILVGKRAGSSTPVPAWKMGLRSPVLAKQSHGVSSAVDKGKEAQTSARRLAATLWEINGSQSPGFGDGEIVNFDGEKAERSTHSPVCTKIKDGSKAAGHRRKSSAISQKLQLTEFIGGMDSVTNGASIEFASQSPATVKTRLKDVSSSLAASKEIIKVLFRLWSHEEQNSSRLTLVSALRVEIDRARHQVDELIHEQKYNQRDIDSVLRQFAAEKAAWKIREQDKVFDAVSSVSRELEIERKLRRQSERLNKRLGLELADSRAQAEKAVKEVEIERRAREVLEQTCNELAKGGCEDRAEVEELKRESAIAREEVERERQMLQLADVLREERVQMKLSEARYEYEEKNAALERLRSELEAYLGQTERDCGNKEFVECIQRMQFVGSYQNGERGNCSEGEEGSLDSELHSIELNMDSLKWSFGKEQEQAEVFKGRRSLSEQIQWENICLQRKTSDGIEWDFIGNNIIRKQGSANGFDKGRLSEASSQGERNDQKPVKGCKDLVRIELTGHDNRFSRGKMPCEVME